jgi:hypothetical protein
MPLWCGRVNGWAPARNDIVLPGQAYASNASVVRRPAPDEAAAAKSERSPAWRKARGGVAAAAYHLSKVFAKLGIESRTQLDRVLSD